MGYSVSWAFLEICSIDNCLKHDYKQKDNFYYFVKETHFVSELILKCTKDIKFSNCHFIKANHKEAILKIRYIFHNTETLSKILWSYANYTTNCIEI